MTRQVEALIASAYLSGTNTRRVKRALGALFKGAIGKDVVSRTWRKVKTDLYEVLMSKILNLNAALLLTSIFWWWRPTHKSHRIGKSGGGKPTDRPEQLEERTEGSPPVNASCALQTCIRFSNRAPFVKCFSEAISDFAMRSRPVDSGTMASSRKPRPSLFSRQLRPALSAVLFLFETRNAGIHGSLRGRHQPPHDGHPSGSAFQCWNRSLQAAATEYTE